MLKFRKILDQIVCFLCASLFALMTILVVYQVVARYILSSPSTWSEELVSYIFAWMGLLAVSYGFGHYEHMSIPILSEKLKGKKALILKLVGEIICISFIILVMIYGGYKFSQLGFGQVTASLGIKIGYMYAVIPVAGIFSLIYCLLNIADILKGLKD